MGFFLKRKLVLLAPVALLIVVFAVLVIAQVQGVIPMFLIALAIVAFVVSYIAFVSKNKRTRKHKMAYYFLLPTITCMLLIHLLPIVQGFWMSFLSVTRETLSDYLAAPFIGFDNYKEVLFDPNSVIRNGLLYAVRNTFLYAFFTVGGVIVIGILVAMLLNREFKGRSYARTLILVPWVIPTYVIGLLWGFMWLRNTGIINIILVDFLGILSERPDWLSGPLTLVAIVVPTIWRFMPMTMLFMLAGLSGINKDVYESADIDGAGGVQKFLYITLPLLKPVIAVQILWGMVSHVYSFNIVIMMFGHGGGFPGRFGDLLMTNLFRNAFIGMHFGTGSAASVILMLIMIGLVMVWYRIFRDNLTT